MYEDHGERDAILQRREGIFIVVRRKSVARSKLWQIMANERRGNLCFLQEKGGVAFSITYGF